MAWRGPLCRSILSALRQSRSAGGTPLARHLVVPPAQKIAGFVSGSSHIPGLDSRRSLSTAVSQFPPVSDPDVKAAFKALMASSWDELPNETVAAAEKALSATTSDKAGQQALTSVFRAAEASVEFAAVLINIRMALEERTGLTGESVSDLPAELLDAVTTAYKRYVTYVNSFGPEEAYLRKKVELELGTRLIHLKQRVSGLGSEWGEINVIGTSGLSGSYVEHRA